MLLADINNEIDLRMDEANAPWFSDEEKNAFFNQAQKDVVKELYKKFEIDEYVRQVLAPLVEPLPIAFAPQVGNTAVADLDALVIPNNGTGSVLMFVLNLEVEITDLCNRTKQRVVKPLQLDDLKQVTNDPFNKPTAREPEFIVENDGIGSRQVRVYVGGTNDTAWPTIGANNTVRILRSPQDVDSSVTPNVECELPDFYHDQLVERTVTLMLENVEAGRLSTHSLVTKTDEP